LSYNYYFPCYLRSFLIEAVHFAHIISMLGKHQDFREAKRCYEVLQTPRAGTRRALLRCFGEELAARSPGYSAQVRKRGAVLPLLARGMEHRRDADRRSTLVILPKQGRRHIFHHDSTPNARAPFPLASPTTNSCPFIVRSTRGVTQPRVNSHFT